MIKRNHPPKWMDRIIQFYCHPDLLEDLQGDLHEYYSRNIQKSRLKADFIFFLDVVKFCRPYTIQKPKFLGRMTFFNLLTNYFKTSVRNLSRNKLFSGINIIGLSVAMSIGILMITYIANLLDFDEFHANKARIYKINTKYLSRSDGDILDVSSTSVFINDKLQEGYAGLKEVLIMQGSADRDFTHNEKTLQLKGLYASESFFKLFSFDLLSGDPKTALKEPYSVVLTETAAEKFFQDENPIGKVFKSGDDSYQVTGLMKNPPLNTHLGKFEMLTSFSTHRIKNKKNEGFMMWANVWNHHVYLLLDQENRPESIEGYLDELSKKENDKKNYAITFDLINLSDVTPGTGKVNNISGSYVNWDDVYKLIVLTFVILASSCFNYTNLSIARSLRRAKEVGIRKVVGARYGQVFIQFIFEAVLISLISLFLAYALFILIRPGFESEVVDSENVKLTFRSIDIIYYLAFTLFVGIVAGVAPALVLSKLKAISVLKDITKVRLFKGMTLRKVLIVFQFSVSMILIISATIAYRQYIFSINYDMGFRTDNILNINLFNTGVDIDLLKNEFGSIPEVEEISTSLMIPGARSMYMHDISYAEDTISIYYNKVDNNYLKIHEIDFLVGGGFPAKRKDSVGYIVVDEAICEKLGFQSPEAALGEVVSYDGWSLEISGVMQHYEYADLQNQVGATALVQNYDDRIYHMNLLLSSSDMIGLMDKLQDAWKNVDPVHPFKAEFYDVQVQNSYAEYMTMFRLFLFLALLAILISTMGLLGIAVFTTETRMKEISVRKVLGASQSNLINLLSRSFIVMLLIAAAIAIPVAYYLFEEYILTDFRERIPIGWVELTPGIFIILFIAFLTITWQTLRAASTNPAEMLRNE